MNSRLACGQPPSPSAKRIDGGVSKRIAGESRRLFSNNPPAILERERRIVTCLAPLLNIVENSKENYDFRVGGPNILELSRVGPFALPRPADYSCSASGGRFFPKENSRRPNLSRLFSNAAGYSRTPAGYSRAGYSRTWKIQANRKKVPNFTEPNAGINAHEQKPGPPRPSPRSWDTSSGCCIMCN